MRRCVNRWPKATIGRHSLSQPYRAASSLREGAGKGCTIHPAAQKPQHCGRFSSPLRNAKTVSFYHSSDDTPSVTPLRAASSLREGAGDGCTIHPAAQKPQRCGRFSSPLRNSEDITLHHSSSHPGRRGRPGRNSGRTGGWRRSGSGDTRRTGLWWRPRRASGGRWAWWR